MALKKISRMTLAFLLLVAVSVSSVYGAFLSYKAIGEIFGLKVPLGKVELDLRPLEVIEGLEAREDFVGKMRVYTYSNNTEVILQMAEVSHIVLNFRSFVIKVFRPLDVIFIVDETGSMAPYMPAVREQLLSVVDLLGAMTKAPVRFGVVAFKDYPTETRQLHLTSDTAKVKEFIESLTAFTGGGVPQSHYLGFNAALDDFLANSTMNEAKMEIFLSDAEAGVNDTASFIEAKAAAEATAAHSVKIYSVLLGPEDEPERSQLKYYADISEGVFVVGAERTYSAVTSDPFWIAKLTPVTPFDSMFLKLANSEGYEFYIWVDFYAKAVRWREYFVVELLAHLEKGEVRPELVRKGVS